MSGFMYESDLQEMSVGSTPISDFFSKVGLKTLKEL